MKAMLSRVGLNELLGFVHRCHSAFPEPSMLILSFNAHSVGWRFNSQEHQRSILARGSQHSSIITTQYKTAASIRFKTNDSDS